MNRALVTAFVIGALVGVGVVGILDSRRAEPLLSPVLARMGLNDE